MRNNQITSPMYRDKKTDPIDYYKVNKRKPIEERKTKNDTKAILHKAYADQAAYASQNNNKRDLKTDYITAAVLVAFRKME